MAEIAAHDNPGFGGKRFVKTFSNSRCDDAVSHLRDVEDLTHPSGKAEAIATMREHGPSRRVTDC
jgi:hypothetical protein